MKPISLLKLLQKKYPKSEYYLKFKTPFQLLVGTIISAQCTDERTSKILSNLFKKHKKITDFVKLKTSQIEKEIKSAGFFRNKAKNIKNSSKILIKDYNGKVPEEMKKLIKLPGVGRKTANVILQNAFGKIEGIIVDTHVIRLSRRFNWTKSKNAKIIEQDLMQLFPKRYWKKIPHILKAHGKEYCKARLPICSSCPLNRACPKKFVAKSK
ncbi:MAG: endonuclease III [Nanoarchaeota archaeon]|nr:endonuclease III [Nanoarchaeota archaeon]